MKNLLTYARVLILIGLISTVYLLFVEFPIKDIKHSNSFLIATLFLILGLIMSFKKKIYRESGAILIIGGMVVSLYYYTKNSNILLVILYSLLFIIPGVIFWFSERKENPASK